MGALSDTGATARRSEVLVLSRQLLGGRQTALSFAALGLSSLVRGITEAASLFTIVQTALAISAHRTHVAVSLGPVHTHLGLRVVLVLALVLVLVGFGLNLLAARIVTWMSTTVMQSARAATAQAFLRARWTLQAQETSSRLQELMSQNASRAGTAVVAAATTSAAIANALGLTLAAVTINPLAAVVFLVVLVFLAFLVRPIVRATRRSAAHMAGTATEYARQVSETVQLAREIRVFDVTEVVLTELADQAAVARTSAARTRFLGQFTPAVYQMSAFVLIILALLLAENVGGSAIGETGAVLVLLLRGLSYGQQVNSSIQQMAEMAPYLADLRERQGRYADAAVDRSGEPLQTPSPELVLDHVRYSYDGVHPALVDASLVIRPGETIGLIGPSGGGKSTLVQILLRLREPDAGAFCVGAQAATDVALEEWLRYVAFVPQENLLMTGTIADNVRFHRPLHTRSAVIRACQQSGLHEDVLRLPLGYDTLVGRGTADLSGGQRQRLGIARALLGGPQLLVLDEPTSALDPRSERHVQDVLHTMRGRMTIVIVAHRMSTLTTCDRLAVLEDGRITAAGTPKQVATRSSYYRQALALSRLPD